MRPGPSTDALAGDVALRSRLEVVRGREVLSTSVPAWDVELDETDDRVVPAQLTFMAPLEWAPSNPLSPLNNFGQRVRASQLLIADWRPSTVGLGWFQIDDWAEQDAGVQVTALDLLTILDENPLVWPSSPPSGATLLSELRRMASPIPVILDPGVEDRVIPRTTQYGTSRTENVRDLCASFGLLYGVQPDGYLHVWAPSSSRDPLVHYSARDLGTPGSRPGRLLSAPRKSQPRRANRFTVVGTQGSGATEQRWSATVSATEPPFDEGSYGVVHERHEMNIATSQAQLAVAADTYMRNAMRTAQVRSLEIPADPRLQRGDVISADTDSGEILTGRVRAYSLPVSDHQKSMRVDVEVLKW